MQSAACEVQTVLCCVIRLPTTRPTHLFQSRDLSGTQTSRQQVGSFQWDDYTTQQYQEILCFSNTETPVRQPVCAAGARSLPLCEKNYWELPVMNLVVTTQGCQRQSYQFPASYTVRHWSNKLGHHMNFTARRLHAESLKPCGTT